MMIDTTKNYWLYVEPHVYCCIKNGQALLYNTHTGIIMETGAMENITLLQSLHEKKNLGTIYCTGKQLIKEPFQSFVVEFCKKGMGNIVDVMPLPEKPVQLMPILNLQRDMNRLQKEGERFRGEEILHYLHGVNIYLNSGCQRYCPFCSDYFRQSLCCRAAYNDHPKSMEIFAFKNILHQIRYGAVGRINLLGGNITEYPYYNELPDLLTDFKAHVHIWNHYTNFETYQPIFPGFHYDIPVTFPVNKKAWSHCLKLFKDTQVKYHFHITNTEEYEETETLIEKNEINDYAIHPIYTKTNLHFFEEFVYVNHEDILQSKLSFREIFAHQKLNTYFFGSFTILPDGDVYANINSSVIGNINTDVLLDMINKEMIINTAWRKIRTMKPCSDCLFQYLCPSPSNYELVTGRYNLCHVQ